MHCVRSHHKRDRTQQKFLKPLWDNHPARPKHLNMTFMSLISEFNELTLTAIS
jgi:hypothetical protein